MYRILNVLVVLIQIGNRNYLNVSIDIMQIFYNTDILFIKTIKECYTYLFIYLFVGVCMYCMYVCVCIYTHTKTIKHIYIKAYNNFN